MVRGFANQLLLMLTVILVMLSALPAVHFDLLCTFFVTQDLH